MKRASTLPPLLVLATLACSNDSDSKGNQEGSAPSLTAHPSETQKPASSPTSSDGAPEDGLIEVYSRSAPGASISWFLSPDDAAELRELGFEDVAAEALTLGSMGRIALLCSYTFQSVSGKVVIRPDNPAESCSNILEVFSPDGRWAVLHGLTDDAEFEVVQTNRLESFVRRQRKADVLVEKFDPDRAAGGSSSFIEWVGSRAFVYSTICCGYTTVKVYNLETAQETELAMMYGPHPIWHRSADGRWIAIGRTSAARQSRVDLVATAGLAGYLLDGQEASRSVRFQGRLAEILGWEDSGSFHVSVRDDRRRTRSVVVRVP